jgi:class 3 adenylate cyclase
MASFADWLRQCGLEQYIGVFADNDVDFAVVGKLAESDLKELGLTLGHRQRLLDAVEKLGAKEVASLQEPDAVTAGAERRQLTILFCDLVGSTALS